ncbi:metalloproteinase inhibitor 2-like isoform X2 [Saccostrea cucullata]|uniref:metalloproteinase inhibitor 2-like isoform X2 n=1 Tax=Saccostrea cuccullata TaxID=36930 RepID=UPI002ED56A9C
MHVFVLSYVFVGCFAFSMACSCFPQHPQVQFCNSDFVVKATVLERKPGNNEFRQEVKYEVNILEDYKNSYGPNRGRRAIYTASNGAACGSYFQLDKTYIIAGGIQGGIWTTYSCGLNGLYKSFSRYQRKAFKRGIYKRNCGCNVVDCTGVFGERKCLFQLHNQCFIRLNRNCWYAHNACTQSRYGCDWDTRSCRGSYKGG